MFTGHHVCPPIRNILALPLIKGEVFLFYMQFVTAQGCLKIPKFNLLVLVQYSQGRLKIHNLDFTNIEHQTKDF